MNYHKDIVSNLHDLKVRSQTYAQDLIVAKMIAGIDSEKFNEIYVGSIEKASNTIDKPVDIKDFTQMAGNIFIESICQPDVFKDVSINCDNNTTDMRNVFAQELNEILIYKSRFWTMYSRDCQRYIEKTD